MFKQEKVLSFKKNAQKVPLSRTPTAKINKWKYAKIKMFFYSLVRRQQKNPNSIIIIQKKNEYTNKLVIMYQTNSYSLYFFLPVANLVLTLSFSSIYRALYILYHHLFTTPKRAYSSCSARTRFCYVYCIFC